MMKVGICHSMYGGAGVNSDNWLRKTQRLRQKTLRSETVEVNIRESI